MLARSPAPTTIIATASISPAALVSRRPGRRPAERRPSTPTSGIFDDPAAHRASRPGRPPRERGGRAPLASDRSVLCRSPRSAGRMVASATTAPATPATIATRPPVSAGVSGSPSTVSEVDARRGAMTRPAASPAAVASPARVRFSTSSASTTWRGVMPTALSVPIWRVWAAIRPATMTAAVAIVSRPTTNPARNSVPAWMSMSECESARRCCQVSRNSVEVGELASTSRWASAKAAASSASSRRSCISSPSSVRPARRQHLAGRRRHPDLRRPAERKPAPAHGRGRAAYPQRLALHRDRVARPDAERVGQPVLEHHAVVAGREPAPAVTSGWSTGGAAGLAHSRLSGPRCHPRRRAGRRDGSTARRRRAPRAPRRALRARPAPRRGRRPRAATSRSV